MKLAKKRLILRIFVGTVAVVIASIVALLVAAYFHDARMKRSFDEVAKGMSKEQVVSLMGAPNSIGKCGELGRLPVPNSYRQEYDYKPLLDIATLAVYVDSKGRVVGKHDYVSP